MCTAINALKNKTADELLEYCGLAQTVPINLDVILKKVGISALPRDFSDIEPFLQTEESCSKDIQVLGAIVTSGENAAIFYNKDDRADGHRCRFTIAHELAHCCLSHRCLDESAAHIDFRVKGATLTEEEIAANIFAGELLIPQNLLNKIIDELLLPSVHILADIFDVSDNVMLARLKHLNISKNISGYNY